jgi:hypothetical protein
MRVIQKSFSTSDKDFFCLYFLSVRIRCIQPLLKKFFSKKKILPFYSIHQLQFFYILHFYIFYAEYKMASQKRKKCSRNNGTSISICFTVGGLISYVLFKGYYVLLVLQYLYECTNMQTKLFLEHTRCAIVQNKGAKY